MNYVRLSPLASLKLVFTQAGQTRLGPEWGPRFIVLFFLLCINCFTHAGLAPRAMPGTVPAQAQADALSDQEQMFLKEISKMSEEEQMQLWNGIVNEVESQANSIEDPVKREQFLNSFWNEVAQEAEKLEHKIQNTPGFVAPAPEPIKEPEVVKEKPKTEAPKAQPTKKPEQKVDKSEEIKKTVEGILSRLSSFMTKTAIIPDMTTRILELKKQGFVAEAPKDFSWATLKRDIEKFTQQLHTLLDKDPKTKQPKYLSAVDEGLRNNLNQLNTKLATYEPKIESTDFAQTRLGKESKNAFNFVVNTVSEAFYVLSVPQELDKVFGTYEPRKQELLKQKEAFEKEAGRPTGPTTVRPIAQAGVPTPELAGKAPAPYKFATPSTGGGFGPQGAGFSGGGGFGGGFGGENEPRGMSAGAGAPSGQGKGGASGLKAPPAPSEKAAPQGAKPTKPEEAKKDGEKKDGKKDEKKEDSALKDLYKVVLESLFNLREKLSDRFLKDLAQYVTDQAPVDQKNLNVLLRTAQAVEAATKAALTAASRVSQWRLRIKRSESAITKISREDAAEFLELYEKGITNMLNQIWNIRTQEQGISAEKKYAFIDSTVIPTKDVSDKLPIPASVYELEDALKQLLQDLRNASAGI